MKRSAVGSYRRTFRDRHALRFRMAHGCSTRDATERKLAGWLPRLSDEQLRTVAALAAFLMCENLTPGQTPPEGIEQVGGPNA